uniref:Uncharacterized protein n=1 Tax=Schistosoma mansoni TaxID=6183 RepID=A0A5K4F974_SCHMA
MNSYLFMCIFIDDMMKITYVGLLLIFIPQNHFIKCISYFCLGIYDEYKSVLFVILQYLLMNK